MDFNDLLHDIAKLEGLHLSSIRPGADIVVEKVDIEHGKVLVKNASGKLFSRSVIEFQKIWEGLNTEPAVRVEEILRGSGSSRNQPETIMANLPYIEWLKITNKKHISYVGKSSHPYGTLKQMDGMSASKINIANDENEKYVIVVSTNDIVSETNAFTRASGLSPVAVAEGQYKYFVDDLVIYYLNSSMVHLPCGIYHGIKLTQQFNGDCRISFDDKVWIAGSIGSLRVIIQK